MNYVRESEIIEYDGERYCLYGRWIATDSRSYGTFDVDRVEADDSIANIIDIIDSKILESMRRQAESQLL